MKTNMLIFILIIIVTCFSCSSNKKIVVEQIDSNYPIIDDSAESVPCVAL